jgi:hypothetical protein
MRAIIVLSILLLLAIPTRVDEATAVGGTTVIEESVDSAAIRLKHFIEEIGLFESNGRYDVVNRHGMMGKYQFSPLTVDWLGYDVTEEEFLSNPGLQEEVMMAYLIANYQSLVPYIEKYNGELVNGIYITESGLLAGAHFAGVTGLIRFLTNTNAGRRDSNGTTLEYYMNKFSDHELEM